MKLVKKICFLAVFIQYNSFSQIGKYLVLFKDKNNNTHSISNPLTFVNQRSIDRRAAQGIPFTADDLPPTKAYIDDLKATSGVTVWYQSRWANAALILMDKSLEASILAKPFVKGFENGQALDKDASGNPQGRIGNKFDIEIDNTNYGNGGLQTKMLGANHLHNAGYKGENMLIAVLDDGFNNVHLDSYLSKIFTENRVIDTYDFVRNTINVYDVGGHGHAVLSNIAADGTVSGQTYTGMAPKAKFALLRSENAPNERIIEEANYLFACERADSLGADIINTSLGYKNYDFAGYNHPTADLNGDKILSTRAADWAARAGILVCISAGNSGVGGIGSPADADSVLTVGAVTSTEIKASFSSIGPTADGRIKPTISAMGSGVTASYYSPSPTPISYLGTTSGTSFSSPISAGFAACLWQANSTLKNMEVIDLLKSIGTQALTPDNNLGYGIPKIKPAIDCESSAKILVAGIENTFLNSNASRVIAQVNANGVDPVTGNITTKVFIDIAVTTSPRPYVQRHFEINPDTYTSANTAKITLFVKQEEFNNYNAGNLTYLDLPSNNADGAGIANLRILQKHGLSNNGNNAMSDYLGATTIIDPADTDIVWNSIEKFWEISFPITGFSAFFLVSEPNTALPLNLVSFSVTKSFFGNILSWKTSNESNFSHFEIEKSTDSQLFAKIGEVKNCQKEINNYEFSDKNLSDNADIYYYRLKMVDIDGSYNYSKIISIKNESSNWVKISPNPITSSLELLLNQQINEEFEIQITDILGNNIFQKKYKNEANKLKINALSWPSGEYLLRFIGQENVITKKIVKQ